MPSNSNKGAQIDPSQQNIAASVPPWLKNAAPMTISDAPNQMNMLASDMAMGGFGTPAANVKWMDQFYNPAQSMKFGSAAAPKPAPKPVVKPTGGKPTGDMMVVKNGKLVPIGGRNAR